MPPTSTEGGGERDDPAGRAGRLAPRGATCLRTRRGPTPLRGTVSSLRWAALGRGLPGRRVRRLALLKLRPDPVPAAGGGVSEEPPMPDRDTIPSPGEAGPGFPGWQPLPEPSENGTERLDDRGEVRRLRVVRGDGARGSRGRVHCCDVRVSPPDHGKRSRAAASPAPGERRDRLVIAPREPQSRSQAGGLGAEALQTRINSKPVLGSTFAIFRPSIWPFL